MNAMQTKIQSLLSDLESERVERTISTTDTDKFGQAICAFANDLPNYGQPGYLIIGANDDGRVYPVQVTDQLLKNVAAIRTDGNIQPQPSMSVQKVDMPEGSIVVVEVQPAQFPPVKYKGRVWVRVGPRKSVANEEDEKRLYEKRASHIRTFDAKPCMGASLSDLDLSLFKLQYLPKAIPEDVLRQDDRPVEQQLQSLGFFDKRFNCPTNAGILLFGKNVERFLPGAYVQYVRFGGDGRAGDILNEYKFAGNLCKVLYQLDTFVDVSVTNRRPVPVSALQEKVLIDYPYWATRELLMNAICHRDYEGNGPIQFYQYDNRIEIMNPGGLYGKVNPQNFPTVNDYRNPVLAEAMKVLGVVNRFSRGIFRVEEELRDNGNGKPVFDLSLGTAFLVTVHVSEEISLLEENRFGKEKSEEKKMDGEGKDGIRNDADKKASEGESEGKEAEKEGKGEEKNDGSEEKRPLSRIEEKIIQILKAKPEANYAFLMLSLGVGETTVYKAIKKLKDSGLLEREKGRKYGRWLVREKKSEE